VDSGGRVDAAGNLFDGSAPTIVATTDRAPGGRLARWEKAGAEVVVVDADGAGGVSVGELATVLGKRDVQSMLVEGGPTLAWSFVRDDMVDKVVMYLAPILVGGVGAASAIVGAGFTPIGSARRVDVSWVGRVGEDLKVEAYVHRDS
jgi:diaminohydroxyphosphoribosylaminopyrimidine deaminase/5-amino-6-(5-phosphoribosylamino)uracil reductase